MLEERYAFYNCDRKVFCMLCCLFTFRSIFRDVMVIIGRNCRRLNNIYHENAHKFAQIYFFLFLIGGCSVGYCKNGGDCDMQSDDEPPHCTCLSSFKGDRCEISK